VTVQPVCAVTVTYHPATSMLENLAKVRNQVQAMVIVDNGSLSHELEPLRVAGESMGIYIIENGENRGVAEALNQGVRWAKEAGYSWVVLFDQDSGITENFIQRMFSTWQAHPQRDRVCSVHPRYVDPQTGYEEPVQRMEDGGPAKSLTSGALMPTWIFDKVGWFASEYFIDFVDWEFCFRIRAAGYLIADSKDAVLLHSPGNPTVEKILGRTVHLSNHNAMRRYYISRNCIRFYGKYLFSLPKLSLDGAYGQFKDTIVCLIAEKNRARKLRNILLGTWDGLTGRMGKRKGV